MFPAVRMSVLRGVAFVAIIAVAGISIFLFFPFVKEGWPTRSPAYVAAVAGSLVLALLGWQVAAKRGGAKGPFYYAGVVLLVVPLVLYGWVAVGMTYYAFRAGQFECQVVLEAVRSVPIEWPGFTQPVGVRLEIDLAIPFPPPGEFLAPKIGPADLPIEGRSLIERYHRFCSSADARTACLTVPFQRRTSEPHAPDAKHLRLAYDLFPATVDYMDPSGFCLAGGGAADREMHDGVRAVWLFGSEGDHVIDLSAPLTELLRHERDFKWSAEALRQMGRALSPKQLTQRGYRRCDLRRPGQCYCRP